MRDSRYAFSLLINLLSPFYFLLGLMLLLPLHSRAASWNVEPIRVELSSDQSTAAITITNAGDQPTSIQALVLGWTQEEGKDVFNPSKELIISPPIFTINPKQEQIVRVGLRQRSERSVEMTYRLNLQELPSLTMSNSSAVQVALRISIPIFVQTQKGAVAPEMAWHVERGSDQTVLIVTLENQGNAHVQITDLAIFLTGRDLPIATETVSSYVLAGQRHQWILKLNTNEELEGKNLRLKAYTDSENIDKEIELEIVESK